MHWTTVCRLTASLPLKEQTRLTFVVRIARAHFVLTNAFCFSKAVDSQTWLSDTRSPCDPRILALSHLNFQGWDYSITAIVLAKQPHRAQDNA